MLASVMPWGLGGKPRMRDQDFKLSFAHIRSVKTDITRRPSAVSLLRRGSTFRYRSGYCCNCSTAIVAVCAYNAPLTGTSYSLFWLVFVVYNTVVGPSTSYCRREPACASERARDSKGLNIPSILLVTWLKLFSHTGCPVETRSHAKPYEQKNANYIVMCRVFFLHCSTLSYIFLHPYLDVDQF